MIHPSRIRTGRLHQEGAPYRLSHLTTREQGDQDPWACDDPEPRLLYIATPDGREIIIRDGARGPRRTQ